MLEFNAYNWRVRVQLADNAVLSHFRFLYASYNFRIRPPQHFDRAFNTVNRKSFAHHFNENGGESTNSLRINLSIACVVSLLASPCLLFGFPGFWGDDLSLIVSTVETGAPDTVRTWVETYGIFYRPVGFSLLVTGYALFSTSVAWMYLVSVSIYALTALCLYRFIHTVSGNHSMAHLTAVLFALCPFAYTAILQLSSLYMLISFVFTLYLFDWHARREHLEGISWRIMLGGLWFLALLIYEQAIALTGILFFLSFHRERSSSLAPRLLSVATKNSIMLLAALSFSGAYLAVEGNPKVKSVTTLNAMSESADKQPSANAHANVLSASPPTDSDNVDYRNSNSFYDSRTSALIGKVRKVIGFFSENSSFALSRLFEEGIKSVLLLFVFMLLMITLCPRAQKTDEPTNTIFNFVFGLFWVIGGLLPFTLYASFHVPVYALLLPWMGAAVLISAAICALHSFRKSPAIIRHSLLTILCGFLYLQQIGVYFGITDQLQYWTAAAVSESLEDKADKKGYEHIRLNAPSTPLFWMENSITHRHFNSVRDLNLNVFEIDKDDHSISRH